MVARDILLTYPDFNEEFRIHTDASDFHLGTVIVQKGKPIDLYSIKLTAYQRRCTVTEGEILSIVETLKECRTI